MKRLRNITKLTSLVDFVWQYVLDQKLYQVSAVDVEKGTADWFVSFLIE